MAVTRIVQYTLVSLLLAAGLVAVGGIQPTHAQAYSSDDAYGSPESPSTYQSPQDGPSSSTGLPSWAEPSTGSDLGASRSDFSGPVANDPPDLPGPPDQVPVDGGLALLAVAGAGYAIRKLRDGTPDEDDAVV